MRDIKFRAWDKVNKLMWGVNRLDFNPQYLELSSDKKQPVKDCLHCLDTCYSPHYYNKESNIILMQYTGLKDKNGKEIYEGDIVHYTSGEYYMGAWEFSGTVVIQNFIADTYDLWHAENLTVIGNIYENPELLEAQ